LKAHPASSRSNTIFKEASTPITATAEEMEKLKEKFEETELNGKEQNKQIKKENSTMKLTL
jgi:hypothetical protein